ncbi:uncharacterized protein LOC144828431 [Lissotriton helveticus]
MSYTTMSDKQELLAAAEALLSNTALEGPNPNSLSQICSLSTQDDNASSVTSSPRPARYPSTQRRVVHRRTRPTADDVKCKSRKRDEERLQGAQMQQPLHGNFRGNTGGGTAFLKLPQESGEGGLRKRRSGYKEQGAHKHNRNANAPDNNSDTQQSPRHLPTAPLSITTASSVRNDILPSIVDLRRRGLNTSSICEAIIYCLGSCDTEARAQNIEGIKANIIRIQQNVQKLVSATLADAQIQLDSDVSSSTIDNILKVKKTLNVERKSSIDPCSRTAAGVKASPPSESAVFSAIRDVFPLINSLEILGLNSAPVALSLINVLRECDASAHISHITAVKVAVDHLIKNTKTLIDSILADAQACLDCLSLD